MFSVRFHFLLWTAVTVSAKETLYRKIGDKAVLTPNSVVNPIKGIEWKHGPDIAMDWYGGETSSYRHFKDRGRLDTSTGALTITGLTPDDSGTYTAEINGKVAIKTELLVISPVSKPTVSVKCEPAMTHCVLTCSGSTTGAEPVTYKWTSGDITWSSTKEHKITKDDKEPWFSCAFENPVSYEISEKVSNPFINKEPLYGKIGDKAVLTPDSVGNPITSIEWKHGLDIAMVWYEDKTFAHRQFKDRGRLDTSTGALTITGLTPDDSGTYTAEINGKVASKTELLVISPVSKPTVSDWCAITYCVLTCSGSTTVAEPVTYRWTSGNTTWPSTKEHKITKENKEPWFSCTFENPVSSEMSEKVSNPFVKWDLIWTFIFIEIIHLVGFIIIIIFFIIGSERECTKGDRIWIFILLIPVVGLILIVCIDIWIIYIVIKERLERWRKEKAAERRRREFLERWNKKILEWWRKEKAVDGTEEETTAMLPPDQKTSTPDPTSVVVQGPSNGIEMSLMLPPDQKTSTQDPTSVVTKDTSNGTEKHPETCRLLMDEQTADPEDEAQS